MKTQLRFGDRDLEILTKEKGGEEPFCKVSLRDFLGRDNIPDFDHSVKWKVQVDRPPRRRVASASPDQAGRQQVVPAGEKG